MAIYFEADDDLPDLPPEALIRQRASLATDDLYRLLEWLKFDRLRIRSALDEAEGRMEETTKAWRRRARFAYNAKGLGVYYIQNELARRNRLNRAATLPVYLAHAFMQEAHKHLGQPALPAAFRPGPPQGLRSPAGTGFKIGLGGQ